MNTFFRSCVFIAIALIIFNVGMTFVMSLSVFPTVVTPAIDDSVVPTDETDVGLTQVLFSSFTSGLSVGALFTMAITMGGAIGLTYLTRSLTPVAIAAFGTVFWVSYNAAFNTFIQFGIPNELMAIATVGMAFFFVAAVIGMASGSG